MTGSCSLKRIFAMDSDIENFCTVATAAACVIVIRLRRWRCRRTHH